MNQEWVKRNLGSICRVTAGQSPKGIYYNVDGIGLPFYQGKKEFQDKYIGKPKKWTSVITKEANKEDILMSVRAPVGPINFATEHICIGRGLAAITSGREVDKEFLYNFLLNYESQIIGNAGAVFNSINKSQIEDIPILLPSLKQQKQIVDKLDQAFAAIDTAKLNVEKNLENAKELFQSKLNEAFSQKSEGWVEKKLGDVCEKTTNINWRDFSDHKFEYIDLSAVSRVSLRITETVVINASDAPSRAKKIIKTDDIIFATTRPTLKRVAIVFDEFNGQICSTGYTVLRSKKNSIFYQFIYYFLQTDSFINRMKSLQRGASYPAVSDNDIKESIICMPLSLIEQEDISTKLNDLKKQTNYLESKYQQELNSLQELKKSILEKAFAGEL